MRSIASQRVVHYEPHLLVAAYLGKHPEAAARFDGLGLAAWPGDYKGPDRLLFYDVLKLAEAEKGLTWHSRYTACNAFSPESYDRSDPDDVKRRDCLAARCNDCQARRFEWWYTEEVA